MLTDCLQIPETLHIDDLVALYRLILEKILTHEQVPGEYGYIFAAAHRLPWDKTIDQLAKLLHARSLVTSPTPGVWGSWDTAADELGFPRPFMRPIMTSK